MPATPRFDAILFDCDGVLVDSESITNGVLRDMLEELGWKLSPQECMQHFIGKALADEVAIIARHTGTTVSDAWLASFRERRNTQLMLALQPIRNILPTVAQLHAAYAGRIACASGADRHKVEIQLRKCGLIEFFEGRIFSGYEMPRSKPAPDVYLAAAAALGVDPRRCAVVEDTVTGATAGVAAGATVFGYSPPEAGHDAPGPLRAVGVQTIFQDMADLPALLLA